eukprot:symbB.v1.2.019855.t1/scaffold1646.1/size107776/1
MNYPPGDEWYEENVTRARLRYHPVARSSEEQVATFIARQREPSPEPTRNKAPVQLATPVPTSSDEKDEKSLRKKNKLGSYKMEEVEERGTSVSSELFPTEEKEPTEGASAWLSANDVTQNATLPPGWASAQDEEGNTYYYHRKDRVPQWEFPEWPESESAEYGRFFLSNYRNAPLHFGPLEDDEVQAGLEVTQNLEEEILETTDEKEEDQEDPKSLEAVGPAPTAVKPP